MALIKCPDCGKEISDSTPSCPNCGKPKPGGKKTSPLAWVVLIIFIIGFMGVCSSLNTPSRPVSSEPTETQAGIIANNFVERQLKSPKSADFPMFDRVVQKTGPRSFRVVSYVDAQNSFGATIRTRFQCKLTYKGGEWADSNNWTLDDITFSE